MKKKNNKRLSLERTYYLKKIYKKLTLKKRLLIKNNLNISKNLILNIIKKDKYYTINITH